MLAIGLVVDDAIVVLENIQRRIELGEPALLAAINGSREIGFAVIATTLVLIAVFVPISFMPGDIGRLFGEFGVTLAAAVGFSALVALTLTPMMARSCFANGMRASAWRDARRPRSSTASTTRYAAGCCASADGAPLVDRRRRRCWRGLAAAGVLGSVPGCLPQRVRAERGPRRRQHRVDRARRLELRLHCDRQLAQVEQIVAWTRSSAATRDA